MIRRPSGEQLSALYFPNNDCLLTGSPVPLLPCSIRLRRMEAAGIEPAVDFDSSGKLDCGCVICEECRAAMALHSDGTDWLDLALADADLQSVIRAWRVVAAPIKAAIRALIGSQVNEIS